VLEPDQLD
jgi:hypothetical protein